MAATSGRQRVFVLVGVLAVLVCSAGGVEVSRRRHKTHRHQHETSLTAHTQHRSGAGVRQQQGVLDAKTGKTHCTFNQNGKEHKRTCPHREGMCCLDFNTCCEKGYHCSGTHQSPSCVPASRDKSGGATAEEMRLAEIRDLGMPKDSDDDSDNGNAGITQKEEEAEETDEAKVKLEEKKERKAEEKEKERLVEGPRRRQEELKEAKLRKRNQEQAKKKRGMAIWLRNMNSITKLPTPSSWSEEYERIEKSRRKHLTRGRDRHNKKSGSGEGGEDTAGGDASSREQTSQAQEQEGGDGGDAPSTSGKDKGDSGPGAKAGGERVGPGSDGGTDKQPAAGDEQHKADKEAKEAGEREKKTEQGNDFHS